MKILKKMMALVIAMVMVLAMGTTVFAASITLTDEPEAYADQHTYNVYQIFTGDVVEKTEGETTVKELQNVKYGASYGDEGASVPKDVLDAIEDARTFGETLVKGGELGDPVATLTKDNNFKAENLAPGYYLIVDTVDGALKEGDVYSQYIVQVLDDVTIETKKDVPSTTKKITSDDHPNTEDGTQNPGVSEDGRTDNVSIGDTVNYEITATVPAHATDYDYYYFIVGDNLSDGLTLDATSIVVKEGDTVLAADTDYALYTGDAAGNDNDFEVALLNAKALAGKTLTITYSATLNEKAVIGGEGNDNKVKTTYSNDPNTDYDGTQDENKPGKPADDQDVPLGETPEEVTKTFTSGIKLQKLDQDGNALTGASFTIEGQSINQFVKNTETFTEDAEGTYYKLKTGAYTTAAPQTEDQMVAAPEGATDGYVVDHDGTIEVGGVKYRVANESEISGGYTLYILQKKNVELYESVDVKYAKTTEETVETTTENISEELPVNADGTLNFEGLGAGTYTIKETVVPEGYTKAADIEVVITFDNEKKAFTATVNGKEVAADSTTNLFPIDVVNIAGNVLPTTGGMGTTLFYIIGGVLVAAAAILLVTRRRMRAR